MISSSQDGLKQDCYVQSNSKSKRFNLIQTSHSDNEHLRPTNLTDHPPKEQRAYSCFSTDHLFKCNCKLENATTDSNLESPFLSGGLHLQLWNQPCDVLLRNWQNRTRFLDSYGWRSSAKRDKQRHCLDSPDSVLLSRWKLRWPWPSPKCRAQRSKVNYLGVWATVKRLSWVMLRFIISLRKSRGELRGELLGESRGDILGEPVGELPFDLGISLMARPTVRSSSELSKSASLMAPQPLVRPLTPEPFPLDGPGGWRSPAALSSSCWHDPGRELWSPLIQPCLSENAEP